MIYGLLLGLLSVVTAYVIPYTDVACNTSVILPITNVTSPNVTVYDSSHSIYTAPLLCLDQQIEIIGEPQNLTITTYIPCSTAHMYQGEWGVTYPIPTPDVQIEGTTYTIDIPYMTENISFVIDMSSDFNSTLRSAYVPNYYSMPTATYPYALNDSVVGAWDIGNTIWSISPSNCSQVNVVSNLTLEQIFQCVSSNGYCTTVTSESGTPFIDISGNLYIQAVQNESPITMWSYPYTYRYNSYTTVLDSTSVSNLVSFTSFSRLQGNYLLLTITSTSTGSRYLSDPSYNGSLRLSSYGPQTGQVQTWNFNATSGTYIGSYSFRWTLMPDDIIVSIIVSTSLIPQPITSQTYTLNTAVETFTNSNFSIQSSGPFDSSSPIYIASVYDGSNDIYQLQITNMWMCYPTSPDLVPIYNPGQGQYGCSQASLSIPSSNIITIIQNSTVVYDSRWTTTIYPNTIISNNQAYGISIEFNSPISAMVYYIQIETRLSPRHRRMYQVVPNIGNAMSAIFVYKNSLLIQENRSNILLSILAVLAVVPVMLWVIFYSISYIWKRRKRSILLKEILEKRKSYLKVSTPGIVENIDDILTDPILLELFVSQCRADHNEEALMFILSVSNYRMIEDAKEKEKEWSKIYDMYVRKNSKYELNIPDRLRECHTDLDIDEIVKQVKFDLSTNNFSKFKSTIKKHSSTLV